MPKRFAQKVMSEPFFYVFLKKNALKCLSYQEKVVPLHRIFAKNLFNHLLTYYESVRNRFHFNSRFV